MGRGKSKDWMPNADGGVALMGGDKEKTTKPLFGGVLGEVGGFEFGFRSEMRLDVPGTEGGGE